VWQNLRRQVQHELSTGIDLTRWVGWIGLAVAVGIVYFVAARLSLALLTKPEGVAVFWPAAGVSAGVLIALGSRARWPVVVGTMAATIAANLFGDRNLWSAVLFALCNAGEAVLSAWLIEHYFGSDFRLDKLRNVLGLELLPLGGRVELISVEPIAAAMGVSGSLENLVRAYGQHAGRPPPPRSPIRGRTDHEPELTVAYSIYRQVPARADRVEHARGERPIPIVTVDRFERVRPHAPVGVIVSGESWECQFDPRSEAIPQRRP